MGSLGVNKTTPQVTPAKASWRDEKPEYREKTAGGVYFYYSPNPLWGLVINRSLYKELPAYAQKAVLALDVSKTADGNHYDIYFVNKDGEVDWVDEYGKSDFMYVVRQERKNMGDANLYKHKWKNVGDILERK